MTVLTYLHGVKEAQVKGEGDLFPILICWRCLFLVCLLYARRQPITSQSFSSREVAQRTQRHLRCVCLLLFVTAAVCIHAQSSFDFEMSKLCFGLFLCAFFFVSGRVSPRSSFPLHRAWCPQVFLFAVLYRCLLPCSGLHRRHRGRRCRHRPRRAADAEAAGPRDDWHVAPTHSQGRLALGQGLALCRVTHPVGLLPEGSRDCSATTSGANAKKGWIPCRHPKD